MATSRQLEIPQHTGCSPPLQDGVHQDSEGVADTGGLNSEVRSQECLPVHPNSQVTSEVPMFPMGEQRMAFLGPSLWSEQCTVHLHQDFETSSSGNETAGNPTDTLPRRHAHHGPGQLSTAMDLLMSLGFIINQK